MVSVVIIISTVQKPMRSRSAETDLNVTFPFFVCSLDQYIEKLERRKLPKTVLFQSCNVAE